MTTTHVRWLHACAEMRRHPDGALSLLGIQDRFPSTGVSFWAVALVEHTLGELAFRFAVRGPGVDVAGAEQRQLAPLGQIVIEAPITLPPGTGILWLAVDIDGVELARTPITLLDPDASPTPIS